jgi:hypothetical protein
MSVKLGKGKKGFRPVSRQVLGYAEIFFFLPHVVQRWRRGPGAQVRNASCCGFRAPQHTEHSLTDQACPGRAPRLEILGRREIHNISHLATLVHAVGRAEFVHMGGGPWDGRRTSGTLPARRAVVQKVGPPPWCKPTNSLNVCKSRSGKSPPRQSSHKVQKTIR